MSYQSVNPYNGKIMQTLDELTDQQLEQLADRFLEKFQRALAGLQAGDPMDEATHAGTPVYGSGPAATSGSGYAGGKRSGYGRELSRMGIQEFVNKKLVRVASIDAAA